MNARFTRFMIGALFLTGVLPLVGQQAIPAVGRMPFACSVHLGIPESVKNSVCKPTKKAAQSSGLSKGLILSDNNGTYTTFDVPGEVNGTYPTSINASQTVTGYWEDGNGVLHGFVRDNAGNFTSFDVPGASYTFASAIASNGTVTGYYGDPAGSHGFVRDQHGTITSFDVPNGGLTFELTFADGINSSGGITGSYYGYAPYFGVHGYIRAHDGSFTSFDPPDGGNTQPLNISDSGAIAGQYFDFSNAQLCFLRDNNGTFSRVQPPGSVDTFGCTVNSSSTVTGPFCDSIGGHGFLRDRSGDYTGFDAPGAVLNPNQCYLGTDPFSINSPGAVTGSFGDSNSAFHGFVRNQQGSITVLDAPGAGEGAFQGTSPVSISDGGAVTGVYTDSSNNNHGFVWIGH